MLRLIVPCGWSARMTNSALNGSAVCARALSDIGTEIREKANIDNQQRELKAIRIILIKLFSFVSGLPVSHLLIGIAVSSVKCPRSSISADERPTSTSKSPALARQPLASGS